MNYLIKKLSQHLNKENPRVISLGHQKGWI